MYKPSRHHYGAVRGIIRYIAGTVNYGILYESVESFKLFGYTGIDWGGSLDNRRSTSSSIFLLGLGAITQISKKQDITALSTTETEYVAMTFAACQAAWLKRLLADMGLVQKEAIQILSDNKSTIAITKNPIMHGSTNHINIIFLFIRDLNADGLIVLKHCNTEEQAADILTKALPLNKHGYFRSLLNICNFQSRGVC